MPSSRRPVLPALTFAALGALALAGCAGVPVQEMSDARQAVRAAQEAGGARYAPETMAEAEKLLKSAKSNLGKGEYRAAREEAEQARAKAMEARGQAEAARADEKAGGRNP